MVQNLKLEVADDTCPEGTPTEDQATCTDSAEARPRIVLTNQQARDIFQLKSGHGFASLHSASIRLASKYGVSSKAIRDIWKGRSWLEATFDLWNVEDRPAKRIIGRPKGKKDSKPRLRGSNTKYLGDKESPDIRSPSEHSHADYFKSSSCHGHEFTGQGNGGQLSSIVQLPSNPYPPFPSSYNCVGNHDPGAYAERVCHSSTYPLLPSIGHLSNNHYMPHFDAPLHAQLQPMSMMCGPGYFGTGSLPPIGQPSMPSSPLSLLGIELLTQRLLGIAADNFARPSLCY
jgi:hypothetical protein